MLCYKDITFCTAKDCDNLKCRRNMRRDDFRPDDFFKDLIALKDFKTGCPKYKKAKAEK